MSCMAELLNLDEPKIRVGVLLWHSRLKIHCCHCSSPGHCRGADLISGLEIPDAMVGMAKKKKKKKKKKKIGEGGSIFSLPEGFRGKLVSATLAVNFCMWRV